MCATPSRPSLRLGGLDWRLGRVGAVAGRGLTVDRGDGLPMGLAEAISSVPGPDRYAPACCSRPGGAGSAGAPADMARVRAYPSACWWSTPEPGHTHPRGSGRVGLYAGKRDRMDGDQGEARHLAADLRELASVARAGSRLADGSCGQFADSSPAPRRRPASLLPELVPRRSNMSVSAAVESMLSRRAFGPRSSPVIRETSCRRPRAVGEHRPGTLIPNLARG